MTTNAYLATLAAPVRSHAKRVHAAKPFGLEEAKTEYETKEIWSLPSPTSVKAAFSQEGLREMFSKLFSGEIQSDDEDFDKAVFITTSSEEPTKTLLDDESVRFAIRAFVDGGGHINVQENSVEIVQVSETDGKVCDPNAVATIIRGLVDLLD